MVGSAPGYRACLPHRQVGRSRPFGPFRSSHRGRPPGPAWGPRRPAVGEARRPPGSGTAGGDSPAGCVGRDERRPRGAPAWPAASPPRPPASVAGCSSSRPRTSPARAVLAHGAQAAHSGKPPSIRRKRRICPVGGQTALGWNQLPGTGELMMSFHFPEIDHASPGERRRTVGGLSRIALADARFYGYSPGVGAGSVLACGDSVAGLREMRLVLRAVSGAGASREGRRRALGSGPASTTTLQRLPLTRA